MFFVHEPVPLLLSASRMHVPWQKLSLHGSHAFGQNVRVQGWEAVQKCSAIIRKALFIEPVPILLAPNGYVIAVSVVSTGGGSKEKYKEGSRIKNNINKQMPNSCPKKLKKTKQGSTKNTISDVAHKKIPAAAAVVTSSSSSSGSSSRSRSRSSSRSSRRFMHYIYIYMFLFICLCISLCLPMS